MSDKKVTLILAMPTGARHQIKWGLAPGTSTRVLRGRFPELFEMLQGRIPSLTVFRKTGGPAVPQGQDLFPLVDDGGSLYVQWHQDLRGSRLDEEQLLSFVGAASDAEDVAEKHDEYLSRLP